MVHCEISGVTDHRMANDAECLARIRSIMAKTGTRRHAGFDRESRPPRFDAAEIASLLPADRTKPYDMHEVLSIIDGGDLDEYKAGYGRTM